MTQSLCARTVSRCSVDGCESCAHARGLCNLHYKRWRTNPAEVSPAAVTAKYTHAPAAVRLIRGLVVTEDGCLEWTGFTTKDGYGEIRVGERMVRTHCLAWSLANGPIPDRLHVLHRCDNPPCCETAPSEAYPEGHLFLGTHDDNMADMVAKGRSNNGRTGIQKTHCPSGHPYSPENTSISPKGAQRCLTCGRATVARYLARKKASFLAVGDAP